jgi:hypothetical protein
MKPAVAKWVLPSGWWVEDGVWPPSVGPRLSSPWIFQIDSSVCMDEAFAVDFLKHFLAGWKGV